MGLLAAAKCRWALRAARRSRCQSILCLQTSLARIKSLESALRPSLNRWWRLRQYHDAGDDLIINGNSLSKTIDVGVKDSVQRPWLPRLTLYLARQALPQKQNVWTALSEYATDQTYSVRINNKTTGSFVISNSNVLDAVDKINAISGSTGVTATATTENKVRLYSGWF